MKKISVIIPIGKFSFFIKPILKNLTSLYKNIDINFVTQKDIPIRMRESFNLCSKEFKFNLIEAPFNTDDHLALFNYAMFNCNLNDWIMIQHCDLFWYDTKWLKEFDKFDKKVFCQNQESQYLYNKNPIFLLGDWFGIYNKSFMKEHNYRLKRGMANPNDFSDTLFNLIQQQKITRRDNQKIDFNGFFDGTEIFSLEMAANHLNEIKVMNLSNDYHHILAFYRIAENITVEGNKIKIHLPFLSYFGGCNEKIWIDAFAKYSYITSHFFEKEENTSPLPWSCFLKIVEKNKLNIKDSIYFCENFLSNYVDKPKECVGFDNLGIEIIEFQNKTYKVI